MEELAPRPLPLGAWLDIVAREYLDRFVPEGGGGLKIVLAEDAGIAETIVGLEALARERELHVVRIDAAHTRLHMPQDLFFALARALPWSGMAQEFLERLFAANFYPWPQPGQRLTRAELAEAFAVAPPVLGREIDRWLSQAIWNNRDLARDFRGALLGLCLARLDSDEADAQPVLGWLQGEKIPAATLRRAGIGGRITRATARAMLVSLCHWVRMSGAAGLLLSLDARRLQRAGPAQDGCVRYSPAAVMDTYEVLRELIDDAEHLPGLFVVVLANESLVGGDPRRALSQYPALQMRVWPDVRPGEGQNPVAPMVRLGA